MFPLKEFPEGGRSGKEYEGEVCVINTHGLPSFSVSSPESVNPGVAGLKWFCLQNHVRWSEAEGKFIANVYFLAPANAF